MHCHSDFKVRFFAPRIILFDFFRFLQRPSLPVLCQCEVSFVGGRHGRAILDATGKLSLLLFSSEKGVNNQNFLRIYLNFSDQSVCLIWLLKKMRIRFIFLPSGFGGRMGS